MNTAVSGGYTWVVLQDCILATEQGIRVEKIDGNGAAFLVFSGDSIRVELFFLMGGKVKYWSNMPCLKEVMLGVRQMMARKMYN